MKLLALALTLGGALMAQVKLPPFSREVLPNGTVVFYLPRTGLPLVSFRVTVKGGAESEPPGLAGLSSVTAELLRRGTEKRSAAQFAEDLDSLGGSFAANSDDNSSIITAEFLKKDFDRGLGLVSDAVLRPSFPDEEVRKVLARRVDGLKSIKDNPGAAIQPFFRSFFFGNAHPYGRPPDEATFDRTQRADVAAYHSRMYVGRNLILVVGGDFDAATARQKIAAAFGAAPAGTAYAWAEDRPPASSGPRVLLVDKPDATQTYFIIAQPGVRRTTADRVPLMLVNTLFGGRFTSMLNDELRVNTGLTYGAASRLEMARLTGALYISTYTKSETTAEALALALDVLKRLTGQGISAEQLASVKAYTKGTYPTQRLQTTDQIAAALAEMELFGLGPDEVDQFFSRVDAVTLAQANDVAQRYYKSNNLTFVLFGNAARVREIAAKYAPKLVERTAKQPGWEPPAAPSLQLVP